MKRIDTLRLETWSHSATQVTLLRLGGTSHSQSLSNQPFLVVAHPTEPMATWAKFDEPANPETQQAFKWQFTRIRNLINHDIAQLFCGCPFRAPDCFRQVQSPILPVWLSASAARVGCNN